MNSMENSTVDNLKFFIEAIVNPAVDKTIGGDSAVADLTAVEVLHWARLGVRIGYFNKKSIEPILSLNSILQSSRRCRKRVSADEPWLDIILPGQRGQAILNEKWFTVLDARQQEFIKPWKLELLQRTFQTLLLLTSENIIDDNSRYFLDSIGWTSKTEWEVRFSGTFRGMQGSVQQIGCGFANVLDYWEEVRSASISAGYETEIRSGGNVTSWNLDFEHIKGPINFPNYQSPAFVVTDFLKDVRAIVSRQFNLMDPNVIERYFVLAGQFINSQKEDTPEWRDARLRIFEDITELLEYFGADPLFRMQRAHFWNLFIGSIDLVDLINTKLGKAREEPKELPGEFPGGLPKR